MLKYIFITVLIALADALPRTIIDNDIIRLGLTNLNVSTIVEKSAENLENVIITLEDVHDKVVDYNFIFEVSGPLSLYKGQLKNISSFKICEKVTRKSYSSFEIPLCFKLLEFEYHYDAEIGWFNRYGDVAGKVHELEITLPINFEQNQFVLKEIQPFKYRYIDVIFANGSIVTNVFNTLTSIFEDIFLHLLKDIHARFILENVTMEVNKVLALTLN